MGADARTYHPFPDQESCPSRESLLTGASLPRSPALQGINKDRARICLTCYQSHVKEKSQLVCRQLVPFTLTGHSVIFLTVTGNIAESLNRTDLQVSRSERAVLIQVIQTRNCHHTGGVEQGIMLMSALAIELPCLETRI